MKKHLSTCKLLFSVPVLLLATALTLPNRVLAQEVDADPIDTTEAIPEVEIQVNEEGSEDDIVALGGSTPCRIRLSAETEQDKTITLVTPPNAAEIRRLSFRHATIPTSAEGTLTLGLPKDGSWVPFSIGGALGSQEAGDATIEAHESNAEGELKGSADVSVYWFRPYLVISVGGYYGWNADRSEYKVTYGNEHAVDIAASAGLKPTGLNSNAPQLAGLQIGIIQNATGSSTVSYKSEPRSFTWLEPNASVRAAQIAPTALSVIQHESRNVSYSIPGPLLDSEQGASYLPFYDTPVPISEVDRTDDTPHQPFAPMFDLPIEDGGVQVAAVRYVIDRVTINDSYTTWAALRSQVSGQTQITPVRQASWEVNVDSSINSNVNPQKATVHEDTAVTSQPIVSGPLANESTVTGPRTFSGTQTPHTYPQ